MSDDAQLSPLAQEQKDKPVAKSAAPAQESEPAGKQEQRPEDPSAADDVMSKRMVGKEAADAVILASSRKHTRRSMLVAGASTLAAYGFYRHLNRTDDEQEMLPPLLRGSLEVNAGLSRHVLDRHALAPTYPLSRAENLRINGVYGLKRGLVMDSYRLQLVGMQNDTRHPRYVPDVTAWEYRYSAAKNNEDKGHDTKVDPAKAGGNTPAGVDQKQSVGGGNAPPTRRQGADGGSTGRSRSVEGHAGRKSDGPCTPRTGRSWRKRFNPEPEYTRRVTATERPDKPAAP